MQKPNLLAFSGSTREKSFNKLLVKNAVTMAEEAGAKVTYVDLRDYTLPLYDGDLEKKEGTPQLAKDFKALMAGSDGFIISTPEYNGALSGVLKNLIDWVSIPEEGEDGMIAFKNKTALIMSASPGGLGGIQGLPILRLILSKVGVHVIPSQVAFGGAHKGFGEDGVITDEKMKERVNGAVKELVSVTTKLK